MTRLLKVHVDKANPKTISKVKLFYFLGGARIRNKSDRELWFKEGPDAFPTLASVEDITEEEMTMEHVESTFALMHGNATGFTPLFDTMDDDKSDLMEETKALPEACTETAAARMQIEPEAPTIAPVAAPVAAPAAAETSMASLERTAPVTAAAMVELTTGKSRAKPRRMNDVPKGAASVSSTPLLPSVAESVNASTGRAAGQRGTAATSTSTSTVVNVFDSMFGSRLEPEAAVFIATTEAPTRPTPCARA